MRKSSILLVIAMGAMVSACGWQTRTAPTELVMATAGAAAGPVQTAANQKPDDPNQIICVREEVTGSRLDGARECHTRAEWAQRKTSGEQQMQLLAAPPNAAAMRANGQ
jgi:cytochrome c5